MIPKPGSLQDRGELIVQILQALHNLHGTSVDRTIHEIVRNLANVSLGTLWLGAQSMFVVVLTEDHPDVWKRVLPYLDPACPAAKRYS